MQGKPPVSSECGSGPVRRAGILRSLQEQSEVEGRTWKVRSEIQKIVVGIGAARLTVTGGLTAESCAGFIGA